MSRTRRIARTGLSQEVMNMLLLPEGTIILGASYDPVRSRIDLVVQHDDLDDVQEGFEAPVVNVLIERVPCECGGTKLIRSWASRRKDRNNAQEG